MCSVATATGHGVIQEGCATMCRPVCGPMCPGASGEDLPYSLMEHVGMNTLGVTVRCVETNTSDRFWGYINTNEMRGCCYMLGGFHAA